MTLGLQIFSEALPLHRIVLLFVICCLVSLEKSVKWLSGVNCLYSEIYPLSNMI